MRRTPRQFGSLPLLLLLLVAAAAPCAMAQTGPPAPAPTDLIVLAGGVVYAPEPLGRKDVLLGGGAVLGVVDPLTPQQLAALEAVGWDVTVYALNGSTVVPGLVDVHVHVTGGGGELGPASRTPEAQLSQLINAGITTLVGVLGTDSVSRSMQNLLFKVRALNADGLTAHMYTGAYRVPVPVLTTSVMDDISLIEQVIGVGELALSDYRSSVPSFDELVRIASDCQVAKLISGKSGIIHVHVGNGRTLLLPLWDVVEKTEIPITQFHLTHIASRSDELKDDARAWLAAGGTIDLTADTEDDSAAADYLDVLKREGLPLAQVTLSSDAFGSFPRRNEEGVIVDYGVGQPTSLLVTLRALIGNYGWTLDEALPLLTTNVARIHSFGKKGRLAAKYDGDVLVLDSDLQVQYVFARGQAVKTPGWVKKGMFE